MSPQPCLVQQFLLLQMVLPSFGQNIGHIFSLRDISDLTNGQPCSMYIGMTYTIAFDHHNILPNSWHCIPNQRIQERDHKRSMQIGRYQHPF